jgi:hypothetical protein
MVTDTGNEIFNNSNVAILKIKQKFMTSNCISYATGLILRVESNQNVESKIKVVEPKDPFCGVHIDALVGCSATLVLYLRRLSVPLFRIACLLLT